MELLVLLALLIVAGLLAAAWAGLGLFKHSEKTRQRAEASAPAILDTAFDGRPDVVFKVNLETPAYETVVLGAKERGYRLAQETADTANSKTLMFERV